MRRTSSLVAISLRINITAVVDEYDILIFLIKDSVNLDELYL
jgi:hypothetical protein